MAQSTEPATLEQQIARLERQQAAIVALARRSADLAGDADAEMRELTRAATATLGVERASVWLLDPTRRELRCMCLYERGADRFSSGIVLAASDYPRYFEALETGRAIDAHDARSDERTSEFTNGYLVPLGITSMMDAAVRDEGRVVGVVCHEHVGPPRVWTSDEVTFAGALGDRVSLALASAERRRYAEERERMQQELLHVQKLESLGVMAGGLAHDFNNLLTIVRVNLSWVRGQLGPEHEVLEGLDDADKAIERASALTRQLLAYSGRAPVLVEPLDLSAHVGELGKLVRASIPKKVALELSLAGDLPLVRADATQLQQLALNLMLNAAEAIGDRAGTVQVRTAVEDLDAAALARWSLSHGAGAGPYVVLEVGDDGAGIAPELLERIFDPFFSTKGSGRGLGLASVAGIVRGHGAGLDIQSRLGRGTTFRVCFPAAGGAAALAQPAHEPQETRATGKILVIDDEPDLCRTVRRVLENAGYQVLAGIGARDGLALFEREGPSVDVVLLDLTMPEMSGAEVLVELRRQRPDARVLLMSGFDAADSAEEVIHAANGFVQKPFTGADLLEHLERALRR